MKQKFSPTIKDILGISTQGTSPTWFPGIERRYLYRGRTAIYHLWQLLGCSSGDEILVPSYNCGAEVDALLKSGLTVVMYRTDIHGGIIVEDLIQRISNRTIAIYITHYFGFPQEVNEILKICRAQKIPLIEDCALALYSTPAGTKLGARGDISFYSLPKTLPVRDGAVLVINNPKYSVRNWKLRNISTYRLMRTFLYYVKERVRKAVLRSEHDVSKDYKALAAVGAIAPFADCGCGGQKVPYKDMPPDFYFNSGLIDRGISPISRNIENSTNEVTIVQRRRRNFLTYQQLLSDCSVVTPLYKSLPEGVCPLQYPVLVDDPNRAAKELQKRSIFAIEWWGGFHRDMPWEDFPEAVYLKQHLLALPVYQNLGDEDIERVCRIIKMLGRTRQS